MRCLNRKHYPVRCSASCSKFPFLRMLHTDTRKPQGHQLTNSIRSDCERCWIRVCGKMEKAAANGWLRIMVHEGRMQFQWRGNLVAHCVASSVIVNIFGNNFFGPFSFMSANKTIRVVTSSLSEREVVWKISFFLKHKVDKPDALFPSFSRHGSEDLASEPTKLFNRFGECSIMLTNQWSNPFTRKVMLWNSQRT